MGLLTAAFVVWLVKSARSRFVKYKSVLQDPVLGTDEDVSNMESIKGHVQKHNRAFETKWADVCCTLNRYSKKLLLKLFLGLARDRFHRSRQLSHMSVFLAAAHLPHCQWT